MNDLFSDNIVILLRILLKWNDYIPGVKLPGVQIQFSHRIIFTYTRKKELTTIKTRNGNRSVSQNDLAESNLSGLVAGVPARGTGKPKTAVVVDTSILMKRPTITDELVTKFDEVLVPEIVVSELNSIKDRHTPNNKQRAWLAMSNLRKALNENAAALCKSSRSDGINDVRIASAAAERARKSPIDKVYILSEDIYFSYLVMEYKLSNLEALTASAYGEKFKAAAEYDRIKSHKFYSLVKENCAADVRAFDTGGVDVNMVDAETGWTPLIQAIRNRNTAMVEYLIKLPGVNPDKADRQKYNFTPLMHAAQLKSSAFELFKMLIENGADYETGSEGKNAGNTPLMVCAWGGFRQGVEYLLAQGACVNQQDTNGFTALTKACIREQYEIGLMLVQKTDVMIRSRENKRADEYITKLTNPAAVKLIKEINNKRGKEE